jgi:hypothetical protein
MKIMGKDVPAQHNATWVGAVLEPKSEEEENVIDFSNLSEEQNEESEETGSIRIGSS